VIVIALVGATYFVAVQRRKPAHLQAPAGESPADELRAPVAAT
jgi:hypothetical protein